MKAVTANELHSGKVLFQTNTGSWSCNVSEAGIHDSETGLSAALEAALCDEEAGLVIGAYAIDMIMVDVEFRPEKLRERIRAEGPTVAYGHAAKLEGNHAA